MGLRVMVPLMDYPALWGCSLLRRTEYAVLQHGEVLHPGNLGHSFLLALGILVAGLQSCTQTHTTYARQDTVNSELLLLRRKVTNSRKLLKSPSTRVEEVSTEVCRRSRCCLKPRFLFRIQPGRREYGRAVQHEKMCGQWVSTVFHLL
ncbi:hypothetical protein FQN60_014460 [Etheostoma spectabile]|uniref:Uncharacterized protein n=1 Tax=Etheostoma spectabile TaxID=54343 RepID=A0A5J5DCH8_9PERO|nr:hypothetical protein FQN60_014460 [Etheostoma spectabile]